MKIAGLLLCVLFMLISGNAFTEPPGNEKVTLWSIDEDGRTSVFIMDGDGFGATKLMNMIIEPGVTAFSVFSLSPDRKKVVFQQIDNWAPGVISDVMVLGIDDGRSINLTNGNPRHCADPRWSPDGKRIVFSNYEKPDHQLYTMNWDGTDLVIIGEGSNPDWSPDGRRIAYVSREGVRDIYIMDSDGSHDKNITKGDLDLDTVVALRWSPTGEQILFSGYTPNNDTRVYTIDIDGRNLKLLHIAKGRGHGHSCWSPDGQSIAFDTTIEGDDRAYIWVMDRDGADLRRLTNDDKGESMPDWRGPTLLGVPLLPNAAKTMWGRVKSTGKP